MLVSQGLGGVGRVGAWPVSSPCIRRPSPDQKTQRVTFSLESLSSDKLPGPACVMP